MSTSMSLSEEPASPSPAGPGEGGVGEEEDGAAKEGDVFRNWVTMGDYGWSMDFGTSQGSVAVEYGRVLEIGYEKIQH